MNRKSLKVLLMGVGNMPEIQAEDLLVAEYDEVPFVPVINDTTQHDAVNDFLLTLQAADDQSEFHRVRRLPFDKQVIEAGA